MNSTLQQAKERRARRQETPEQCAARIADECRAKIRRLNTVIASLAIEGTWPAAGSLGHINETLGNLLEGWE